ncbi:MAG: hypothetical protein ACRBK7_14545 [Acidimicrobiales bacterium]
MSEFDTVVRENIAGAFSLDVSGHGAAELTLTGDASLTLTGWDADTTLYQRLRVQIVQDGTGGHSFDWANTNGHWTEFPADSALLDSQPGDTSLQFYAITTDGGATVWLEPIGLAYTMGCLYAQTVEADIPATSAGGSALVGHSFAIVGSVDLIRQSDNRRVAADWRHVASEPSSDVEIDFSFAVAAGDYKVRMTGQSSTPCVLSVSSSPWVSLVLSTDAALSLSPRLDFIGATGDVQWLWGDGSTPEDVTSGAEQTHTYGAAYSGNVTLRHRPGVTITRFDSPSDRWNFNTSTIAALTGLTYLRLDGTQVSGDVGAWAGLTGLTYLNASSTSVSGNVGQLATLTGLTELWLSASSVDGDIGQLTTMSALDSLYLNSTSASGDVGSLAAIPGIGTIQLSDSSASGDVAPLAAITGLRSFRVNNTAVNGDVVAFNGMTTLVAVQAQNTGITGNIDSFNTNTLLSILEVNNTAIAGSVSLLNTLGSLTIFRANNTSVTGDPSVVSTASAATLTTFVYLFVGVLPTGPQLDQVITDLAGAASINGTLSIAGTNPPITNTAGVTTLQGRGWTVATN